MTISIILGGEKHIELGAIESGPEQGLPLITALGLAYLNWGRLEQTLEFLLRYTDDPRLVTGGVPRFPDTSFRLKLKLFKNLYTKHTHFKEFHESARLIAVGLKKANDSRVRLVHSNFQGFTDDPHPAIKAVIAKWKGPDLQTFDGTWTFQAIRDFNTLLCHLNNDLAAITARVMTPDFLQSLEIPLSRTDRAILALRRRLSRLPRLRIERPFPLA
ncbi:MAG: hypothetical protein OJI67_18525 [Prosthecobacter sp.]|nr:hypothetical protein [Prosthecobacter sp.]